MQTFSNSVGYFLTGCCCCLHRGPEKTLCNYERRFSTRICCKFGVSLCNCESEPHAFLAYFDTFYLHLIGGYSPRSILV